MVNVVFTIFSLVILVVAVVSRGELEKKEATVGTEVLSATSLETPTNSPVPSETPSPEATLAPASTSKPTVSPTQPSLQTSIADWIYPNSSVQIQTASELKFTTNDNAKIVFAWYKDKIGGLGYNTRSAIQTQSNEKILDKLSADNSSSNVAVEIKQDNASQPVTVTVSLTGSSGGDVHVSVNNSI